MGSCSDAKTTSLLLLSSLPYICSVLLAALPCFRAAAAAAAAASSVNPIYIAELLPTSCRSSVMGICSQASRVGSVAAPFLLMLGAQVVLPGRSQVRRGYCLLLLLCTQLLSLCLEDGCRAEEKFLSCWGVSKAECAAAGSA